MIFYMEDAPVDECSAANGLSKALNPLFKGEERNFQSIVLQSHAWFDVDKTKINNTDIFLSKIHWYLTKITKRFSFFWGCKFAYIHMLIVSLIVRRKIKKLKDEQSIFIPVGVDYYTLLRGVFLARFLKVKAKPYFVDDLFSHPKNRHLNIDELITPLRADITISYYISPQLKRKYNHLLPGKKLQMYLPFEEKAQFKQLRQKQNSSIRFLFIGSIALLYEDTLSNFCAMLQDYQLGTIHIVSSDPLAQTLNRQYPQTVNLYENYNDNKLETLIKSMDFGLIPSSFHKSVSAMVSSSFPSKFNTYVANGLKPLYVGPDYSPVYQFLKSIDYPYVYDNLQSPGLRKISTCNFDASVLRNALDREFSAKAFLTKVG